MTQTPPRANESATGFVPYDVAEHLRTPEEMAAYLEAWLEEAPDDVGC
jgi:DNA-binding phage protein